MKKLFGIAMAATIGLSGLIASANEADARRNSGGGVSGFSGGGGGGMRGMRMASPRMSGGGGSMRGMRMNSPSFTRNMGPRISRGDRMPRFGNMNRSRQFGDFNRSRKWAGGNNWNRPGKWRGNKRRFRNFAFYGAPFVASSAYYYGGYGGDCEWLYDRAIQTGSGYWWARYNECRYDYY